MPGHERFVKNMLAGVGGIDAVMLVIAADEAVMPQTREHLDICALLRVKRGLTVLTKIDTTERDIVDLAEMEVREFLKGSFLQDAPLLRVSSLTGEGIAALTAELRRLALEVAPRDASQIFRLPGRPLLHDERLRHGRVRHADRRTDPQRRRGRGAARAAGRAGARHPGARPQRGRKRGPASGRR